MFVQRIGTTNYQKQPHFNARMVKLDKDSAISADRIIGLLKGEDTRKFCHTPLAENEVLLLLERGFKDYILKGKFDELSNMLSEAKSTSGKTMDLSEYVVKIAD